MTENELKELKTELKEMTSSRIIFLGGFILMLIVSLGLFYFKNKDSTIEEYTILVVSVILVSLYFTYNGYWKPRLKLKRDLKSQMTRSITTEVFKIQGKNTSFVVRTEPKFRLVYYDFERFRIPIEIVKVNTKIHIKFAKYSKHLFQLQIME